MVLDGWPDAEIADGLRKQDSHVLERIISRFSREIFYFMRMILNNVGTIQDVEECVSDLFVSVWEEHDAFNPERGSFRTWLTMRAKYLALDRRRQLLRRQGTTVTLTGFDADGEISEQQGDLADRLDRKRALERWADESLDAVLERREEQTRLWDALLCLPDVDRQLVYLRYFRLTTTEDIATQTGLSRHAIDTRLWRARKHLKEALREPSHERI